MYYVGVDLGGTNIAAGIVTREGRVLAKKSLPTGAERSEDAVIADMANAVRLVMADANVSDGEICHVGVGSPGSVELATGIVREACNLHFRNTELARKLSALLDKPVYLENDANCAAWAEAKVGAAAGTEHSVMLTLGTGIGGGIVVDGRLYHGFNNFAGEFGHTVIHADGEPCKCGKRGCFEAYASATSLIRDTKRAAEGNKESLLWAVAEKAGGFSGRTAFDAAKAGDATAQAVVDRYIRYLALGVSNVIKIFQPEVVVIGGGVAHEGDTLFVPLARQVVKDVYGDRISEEKQTKIVAARLGNDAGIVGAALLKED